MVHIISEHKLIHNHCLCCEKLLNDRITIFTALHENLFSTSHLWGFNGISYTKISFLDRGLKMSFR